MAFFIFEQSNPGGRYCVTIELDRRVIIEAANEDAANARAENEFGIYFNGASCQGYCAYSEGEGDTCDCSTDCPCCGDRWFRTWENRGYATVEAALASSHMWDIGISQIRTHLIVTEPAATEPAAISAVALIDLS